MSAARSVPLDLCLTYGMLLAKISLIGPRTWPPRHETLGRFSNLMFIEARHLPFLLVPHHYCAACAHEYRHVIRCVEMCAAQMCTTSGHITYGEDSQKNFPHKLVPRPGAYSQLA